MVQIMGLSCIAYGMTIVDKKVYTLQKLCSFNYPSTLREIKKGGMKTLLKGFGLVKEREIKQCNCQEDEYISAIIIYPDSEDEQEDEQKDESQEGEDGYDVE